MGNGAYGIDVFAKHFSVAAYDDKCMTSDWSDLVPETVAEMGPGGGIGAGLAALVFGAKTYYTFEGDLRSMQLDAMVALNEIIFLVNNGYVPRNSQSAEIARGRKNRRLMMSGDRWMAIFASRITTTSLLKLKKHAQGFQRLLQPLKGTIIPKPVSNESLVGMKASLTKSCSTKLTSFGPMQSWNMSPALHLVMQG